MRATRDSLSFSLCAGAGLIFAIDIHCTALLPVTFFLAIFGPPPDSAEQTMNRCDRIAGRLCPSRQRPRIESRNVYQFDQASESGELRDHFADDAITVHTAPAGLHLETNRVDAC